MSHDSFWWFICTGGILLSHLMACIYICIQIHIHTYTYIYIHLHMYMYFVCICICIHMYMHVFTCIYLSTYIHLNICIHIYVYCTNFHICYKYMHTCWYKHIFVYTCIQVVLLDHKVLLDKLRKAASLSQSKVLQAGVLQCVAVCCSVL